MEVMDCREGGQRVQIFLMKPESNERNQYAFIHVFTNIELHWLLYRYGWCALASWRQLMRGTWFICKLNIFHIYKDIWICFVALEEDEAVDMLRFMKANWCKEFASIHFSPMAGAKEMCARNKHGIAMWCEFPTETYNSCFCQNFW